MVQEIPINRKNCTKLIDHAFFKENDKRLEIIREIAKDFFCTNKSKCNEKKIETLDKKNLHMVGFSHKECENLNKFIESSNFKLQADIKVCSSLLQIFANPDIHFSVKLKFLTLLDAAMPNFFPYLYIDEQDLSREYPYGSIFQHDLPNCNQNRADKIVYKGKFGDRDIAIKRVAKSYSASVEKEISVLLMNNSHLNILKYYAKEMEDNVFYIGAEFCEFNLTTLMGDESMKQKMLNTQNLQQLAQGLHFLHKNSISK